MNTAQRNRLDALKRAYVFVTTTPLPTPLQNPTTGLSDQIVGLKATIDAADTQATSQTSGTVQQTIVQRDALGAALRRAHLEPILHVARVLEKGTPGLPKLINLRETRTAQGLLNSAQAVLRDLVPYKDLFIARGLPADFLDQLQSAITAFESAWDATRETRVVKVQSRTGIDTALQEGDNHKKVIGAIIRRAAPFDPNGLTFLRGWKAASHVKRSKSGTTATAGATPPETPAPSSATSASAPAAPAPSESGTTGAPTPGATSPVQSPATPSAPPTTQAAA